MGEIEVLPASEITDWMGYFMLKAQREEAEAKKRQSKSKKGSFGRGRK